MPQPTGEGVSLQVITSHLTTAGLPQRERFDFWREAVYKKVGIDSQPLSRQQFFGELTTARVNEGFAFTHLRCRGHRCGWTHFIGKETVHVSAVFRGKSWSVQDGREVVLVPGDFRFVDSTRPFSETMDDEYEVLTLGLPREMWLRRIGSTEQITARAVRGNTYLGGLVFNFFRQLFPGISAAEPGTVDHLAEVSLALVNALADTLMQDESRGSGRILLLSRAKTLIEQNLDDPNLNPEKVAQALRISARYLRELFQEQGTSVCRWIWDRRVEKCRQRLSDPLLAGQGISEIAFGCGFNDFAHFSRRFKATFLMSPTEFRRKQLPVNRDN